MGFKTLAASLAVAAAGTLALQPANANTLLFQGVTFETLALNSTDLQLSILNATSATGDWTGIGYLSAFELQGIKGTGDVTDASVLSGPGTFTTDVDAQLSASGIGCGGGGTPGGCFAATSPIALTDSMVWTLHFVDTGLLDFSAPSLKVQFLTNAGDSMKTGSLLSQTIPAIPEPETYAMLLAGLGLLSLVAGRRKQSLELSAA
jgi:hypothetical protein